MSFLNPHDITAFPFSYLLTPTSGVFGSPHAPQNVCYPSPDTAGAPGSTHDNSLPALNAIYSTGSQPPTNWNYYDNPISQIYNSASGTGKPGLQLTFQQYIDAQDGAVLGYNPSSPMASSTTGWTDFLNYYIWMQSCVDAQIGYVLQKFYTSVSSAVQSNTIIIFLSDHGDYGGSHWLHAKGGALYDESINVPLYISFPGQRTTPPPGYGGTYNGSVGTGVVSPYVCSSVDILPFLYGIALGSEMNWRTDPTDVIHYLNGRESIVDSIFSPHPLQRRISTIPNQNGSYNLQAHQPYILHTTDEFSNAGYNITGTVVPVPSHAIAFRTVDLTVTQKSPDGFNVQGGGKLGIYSYWPPTNAAYPTQPELSLGQQFEFYDYTGGNLGEIGNQFGSESTQSSAYLSAFNTIAASELYYVDPMFNSAYNTALSRYIFDQNLNACPTGE